MKLTDNDEQYIDSVEDVHLRKEKAYLKDTTLLIPTYKVGLMNKDGKELRVAPGPRNEDVLLVVLMEEGYNNVFSVFCLIRNPNWRLFRGE